MTKVRSLEKTGDHNLTFARTAPGLKNSTVISTSHGDGTIIF
jgi:hypothetical protein